MRASKYELYAQFPSHIKALILEADLPQKMNKVFKYTFQNRCVEAPALKMKDETLKVFVNAAGNTEDVSPKLGAIISYIRTNLPVDQFTQRIDRAVESARLKEEWRVEYTTLNIRDMDKIAEGRAEGRAEGLTEGLIIGSICIYKEEMNLCDEEIKTRLVEKYHISEAEAEEYLKLQAAG